MNKPKGKKIVKKKESRPISPETLEAE